MESQTSNTKRVLQMGSFFVEQGTQMNRRLSILGGELQIPAASLALFNTVSIIALIPVYDRILVPSLRYFGKKITLLQRIGKAQPTTVCNCPCQDAMQAMSSKHKPKTDTAAVRSKDCQD